MSRKAIILLTLTGLFTLLSWILFIPFVSDLYALKNERALLSELQALPLEEKPPILERESTYVQERLSESALEKGKRSLLLLASLPFFAKLLFGTTLLLMLMLLREIPDAEKAVWILPLLSLALLLTLPKSPPSKRELLYPNEREFPKEAFSSVKAWEEAWRNYLDQKWQGDPLRFQLYLATAAPYSEEREKPLIGPLLTLFFLSWTSYSAYQLNRRRAL